MRPGHMVLLYGSTTKAARCVHLISISSRNDQSLRDVTSMANGRRGRSGPTFFSSSSAEIDDSTQQRRYGPELEGRQQDG